MMVGRYFKGVCGFLLRQRLERFQVEFCRKVIRPLSASKIYNKSEEAHSTK